MGWYRSKEWAVIHTGKIPYFARLQDTVVFCVVLVRKYP